MQKKLTIQANEIHVFTSDLSSHPISKDTQVSQMEIPLTPRSGTEAQNTNQNSTQLPPWETVDKNGRVKNVPLPMDAVLYEKMNWLTNNLPKMSLQKLAIAGTTAYVDALIEKHYKG
jgi:hypothetical protein